MLEILESPGGMGTVGAMIFESQPNSRIGALVAGNSGRPGGSVGLPENVNHHEIHAMHRTQEEDIVSSWLYAECGNVEDARQRQTDVFRTTIARQWGMLAPETSGVRTVQGVNYSTVMDPASYGDAWTVRDAYLCGKSANGRTFDLRRRYPATLVFVAGPNAGARGATRWSTTERTFHSGAARDYIFFRQAVVEALRAGFDGMALEGVTVALVARVSTGIYSGPHKERISREMPIIISAILQEPVGPRGETRGQYFDRVVMPMLPVRPKKGGRELLLDGLGASFARFRLSSLEAAVAVVAFLVMVGLGTAHLGTFPTTSAASTAGLQAAAAALAFLVFAVAAADALWDM